MNESIDVNETSLIGNEEGSVETTSPVSKPKNIDEFLDNLETNDIDKKELTPANSDGNTSVSEFKYPEHWSEQRRSIFNTLSNESKEIVINEFLDMEKGFQRSVNKDKESLYEEKRAFEKDLDFSRSVKELFPEELKQFIYAKGMDESSVIKSSVANFIHESKDVIGYVENVLNRNGIDIYKLAESILHQREESDPYGIQQLIQQTIAPFKNKISQLEVNLNGQSEIQAKKLISYMEENSEKYPYFEKVKGTMSQIFQNVLGDKPVYSVTEADMEKLYNEAVYFNPEIRELLIASEKAKAIEEIQKKSDAEKASQVGKSIQGMGSTKIENKRPRTINELLDAQYG